MKSPASVFSPARLVRCFALLLPLILGMGTSLRAASAAGSAGGSITGVVINAATKNSLEGAQVGLRGTRWQTLTRRDGSFELSSVPAGEYTLEVSYTGLDPQTVPVNVGAGTTAVPVISLHSDVYQLDAFTVAGEREGSAAAITAQRNAANVKQVVATDAFGNIVDGNIGEFLKRASGVSTELNEGEVDKIFVRGISADFSAVTLDGTRLPSPAAGKKSRAFEVDKLPADYIESIEVIKAPTPDMDADSVGGAVNLITKSAFDIHGRRISYTFGQSHKTLRNLDSYYGGLQYSDVIGGKLGVYYSFNYSDVYVPQDTTQMDFDPSLPVPSYVWRFRMEDAIHLRNRTGHGLKLEYRLGTATTLYTSLMYSHYKENVNQKRITLQSSKKASAFLPGYTDYVSEANNAKYTYSTSNIDPEQKTFQVQLGGKTHLPGLALDYSASVAPASAVEHRQNLDMNVAKVKARVDLTQSEWYPTVTFTGGPDVTNYDNLDAARLQATDDHSHDSIWGGEFNARKDLATELPTFVKAGMRYRGQKVKVDSNQLTASYAGPDGKVGTDDDNLAQFKLEGYDYAPVSGRYAKVPWSDVRKAYAMYRGTPQLWDEDLVSTVEDSLSDDGSVREDIYAAYVMGNVEIGRANLLAGIRAERTDVSATGVFDRPDTAPLPSNATEEEEAASTAQELGGHQTRKARYTSIFPGIHLRYKLNPGLQLRASWSTSIARPNYGDLMPNTSIDYEEFTISQNNTALKPQRSNNFDVSLEYYFEPVGLISIGAFYKDIEDFIFTNTTQIGSGANNGFGGEFEGFTLDTQQNGGAAKVKGLEFNYSQQLSFLPAALRGFSVFANYTLIDAKGNYNSGGTQSDDQLVQFVPQTWNLGLAYQNHGFTIRGQVNYNDRYLESYDPNPGTRIYDEPRYDTELRVKYAIRPYLSVFCEYYNVANETIVRSQGFDRYRPQKVRYNGRRINVGITGNF